MYEGMNSSSGDEWEFPLPISNNNMFYESRHSESLRIYPQIKNTQFDLYEYY